jgi:predicted RNase H-like HicB family nuclease
LGIIESEESWMLSTLTARYVKIDSGYMGQIIEWPEVVTEGHNLEECRASLRDALHEMILAYRETGKEPPAAQALFEPIVVESA